MVFVLLSSHAWHDHSVPWSIEGESARAVSAFVGGTVFVDPTHVITDAVIVVEDGRIAAVGSAASTRVPDGATIIDVTGKTVTAGFWNAHVHLYRPEWFGGDTASAVRLEQQFVRMLTRYGFSHVVDIGSKLQNTRAIARRVRTGEIAGPTIIAAGQPLFPRGGISPELEPLRLPEAGTPAEARAWVQRQLADSAELIKLYLTAYPRPQQPPVIMPLDIAKAAVDEAHKAGKLVVAHPGTMPGLRVALAAGVDILAHTAPEAGAWPQSVFDEIKARHMLVIPTLQLWQNETASASVAYSERFVQLGVDQLRGLRALGVDIAFGTDVGYMDRVDPTADYQLMARAGMSAADILASLTTTPARWFSMSNVTGRIAVGSDADLVVLNGDPRVDIKSFASVDRTYRRGQPIFQRR